MKPYEVLPQVFPANACTDLDHLPGESVLSSSCRFAWRNGMDAKTLLAYCLSNSLPSRDTGDRPLPFEKRLAAISGWNIHISKAVSFDGSDMKKSWPWWSSVMRYCPVCLEHLYHSPWHQCEFLTHCPFDGALLLNRCYECKAGLPHLVIHKSAVDIG